MPLDLSTTLVVGVSSTALFELGAENKAFEDAERSDKDSAIQSYRDEMRAKENDQLKPGVAFPLVQALLKLDAQYRPPGEDPLVEVVVLSRNSPETGLRVLNSIRAHSLQITRSSFRGGQSITPLLGPFGVDLLLTASLRDAQEATDTGVCAAGIVVGVGPQSFAVDDEKLEIRIAFDGDAVLFDGSSEMVYKEQGIEAFHAHEAAYHDVPLPKGVFAALLQKIAALRQRLPMKMEYSPVRIILVTARNGPSELRVINTFRDWQVYVDEAHFLGGLAKAPFINALKPHIFFDDQDAHLSESSKLNPCVKVLYPTDSPLHAYATKGGAVEEDQPLPIPAQESDA